MKKIRFMGMFPALVRMFSKKPAIATTTHYDVEDLDYSHSTPSFRGTKGSYNKRNAPKKLKKSRKSMYNTSRKHSRGKK